MSTRSFPLPFSTAALLSWLLFVVIFSYQGFPQVTKIVGRVTDSITGEAIPFVNVVVDRARSGTVTDFNGDYHLEITYHADSIAAFLIGYRRVSNAITPGQFQTINFRLSPQKLELPEVTIIYSGNPAERIIREVIRNKDKNTFQDFRNFQYEAYTKLRFDANNISEKLKNQRIFNKFSFVWSYMDTSTLTGKSYLPMMMVETLSDVFERKEPRVRKEIVKASSISGLNSPGLTRFFANISDQVNIYANFIPLFQKNFAGPVSTSALSYYKYYLVDSAYIDSHWCYHLMFKPRRAQELTFTGSLWIADTSFAIKKVSCRITDDANINFINDLEINQEFQWVGDRFWMLSSDRTDADFNFLENSKRTLGVYAHRTVFYRHYKFDIQEEKRFFKSPSEVSFLPDASEKTADFWLTARPEALTKKEKGVYDMVDSVKMVPLFRTYTDILYTIFKGYLPWGYVELGPYFNVISYNEIEGVRFRLGAITSNKFSKKTETELYLAYGTLDQKLKYGGNFTWIINKDLLRAIRFSFRNDVEQLGASSTAAGSDNLLSSMFFRGANNKLTHVRDFRLTWEREWFSGLINRLHFTHRQQFPLGSTEFIIYPGEPMAPVYLNSIYTTEIQLDTRIAVKEKFITTKLNRYTLSSTYPIVQFSYIYGIPGLLDGDYEYHKLILNVSQWFNFSSVGWSKYIVEAGKIYGKLPYPLLRIHDGNQSFVFDEHASNLMNYYEFVSDRWISASYTHHFNGFFFNRIPLIRKLYWRELVHIKGVYGTLSDRNQSYSALPGQMRSLSDTPYLEAGVGVENILKVIRIDAVWRMTHLDDTRNRNVPKFGIFASLFFSF